MNVTIKGPDGYETIDATICRDEMYGHIAHWQTETGPCSVPVRREGHTWVESGATLGGEILRKHYGLESDAIIER